MNHGAQRALVILLNQDGLDLFARGTSRLLLCGGPEAPQEYGWAVKIRRERGQRVSTRRASGAGGPARLLCQRRHRLHRAWREHAFNLDSWKAALGRGCEEKVSTINR